MRGILDLAARIRKVGDGKKVIEEKKFLNEEIRMAEIGKKTTCERSRQNSFL